MNVRCAFVADNARPGEIARCNGTATTAVTISHPAWWSAWRGEMMSASVQTFPGCDACAAREVARLDALPVVSPRVRATATVRPYRARATALASA